jgi:hypothetical protein
MAAKTGRFKLNGKDYPFEMTVRRSIIVDLVGGLDNNGNCEVGLYEANGVPLRNRWLRRCMRSTSARSGPGPTT